MAFAGLLVKFPVLVGQCSASRYSCRGSMPTTHSIAFFLYDDLLFCSCTIPGPLIFVPIILTSYSWFISLN